MAAGGLGGDPVPLAEGGALRGSPVTARAAFVSAFLGNSWSRAREDGMGEGTGRDSGGWGCRCASPVAERRGNGILCAAHGDRGAWEG